MRKRHTAKQRKRLIAEVRAGEDETYICIRDKWHYLYRAVDEHGKTVDLLPRPDLGVAAAQAFFRKGLG